MITIRWTDHARGKAAARQVSIAEADKTLTQPDAIVPGRAPRRIFMRRYFDAMLEVEMLLRVVVEETAEELTVITLYKTSNFKKYEGDP